MRGALRIVGAALCFAFVQSVGLNRWIVPAASSPAPAGNDPLKSSVRVLSAPDTAEGRAERIAELNLPWDFARQTAHRILIDEYAQKVHLADGPAGPTPFQPTARKTVSDRFIRVVRPPAPELAPLLALKEPRIPSVLRGYRTSILDPAPGRRPVVFDAASATTAEQEAAGIVARRLAHDGLLATLVQIMQVLGPAKFSTNNSAAVAALWDIGFPVDLLACFEWEPGEAREPNRLASRIARRLLDGASVAGLQYDLNGLAFRFPKSRAGFRAAEESGEHDLGMFRMQIGGGYDGGIIPGDSIDLASQLVDAVPDANFVISVPEEFLNHLVWLAQNCWPLKRRNHVTFISGPPEITPWAQDNGKAGAVGGETDGLLEPATLIPRFASQGEDGSVFRPAESQMMPGLRAVGHLVIPSPLLFQGGNLMAVRHPSTGQRTLLVGQAEVYRNIALGLTREQVLEAFRVELGVDSCVVLPVVSHHLDLDVSVRAQNGELIAFVNDTRAAVRLILECGIDALEKHGSLTSPAAQSARESLKTGEAGRARGLLSDALRKARGGGDRLPAALSACFASGTTDSPADNVQCFLVALDILGSTVSTDADATSQEPARSYFTALRDMESALRKQREALQKLGWKIVPVPSLPDLYRNINYLNGVHERTRFIMPAYGGFYATVDQAATQVIQQAVGPNVQVIPIFCAASQRHHGGVHCVTAAYPQRWPVRSF